MSNTEINYTKKLKARGLNLSWVAKHLLDMARGTFHYKDKEDRFTHDERRRLNGLLKAYDLEAVRKLMLNPPKAE
jgi:hypothetical protein